MTTTFMVLKHQVSRHEELAVSNNWLHRSQEPNIDVETVRDTIALIRGDIASSSRLSKVHEALSRALDEIAALEPVAAQPPPQEHPDAGRRVVPFPGFKPQFRPWSAD